MQPYVCDDIQFDRAVILFLMKNLVTGFVYNKYVNLYGLSGLKELVGLMSTVALPKYFYCPSVVPSDSMGGILLLMISDAAQALLQSVR